MGQDAECYQKTVDDRTIILNQRAWYAHPFVAGDWVDLRLGFFLSLTDAVNDDLTFSGTPGAPGDLAETIANPGLLDVWDRYQLGVAGRGPGGNDFIGFTNTIERTPNLLGDTVLVSSDGGIGAGTNFWRPANSKNNAWGAAIYDGNQPRAYILDNVQQHFPQNAATVAAGYAVLLALQLLRDKPDSRTIRVKIKSSTKSADWMYSNTPTKELIHQAMANWPPSAQMGPVTLSVVPTAFYFYWPFRRSRLRVHSLGLLRAA
jgi:hypothetical protein